MDAMIGLDLSGGIDPRDWYVIAATWFGAGLVQPLRAGLALTVTLPLAVWLSGKGWGLSIAVILPLALIGTLAADLWEAHYAIHDDRRIVIDEVVAFLVGARLLGRVGWAGAAAFGLVFLTLDRLKPWPFYLVEALPGGLGVMADDLAVALALVLGVALFRWAGTTSGAFRTRQ